MDQDVEILKDYFSSNSRLCNEIIFQAPLSILITDKKGVIQFANQNLLTCTGYELHEVLGKTPLIFKSGITSRMVYSDLWDSLNKKRIWRGQLVNKKKNGDLYVESVIISPILDEMGEITHFFAIKEDISDRLDLQRKLEISQTHDRLTSLMNRIEFEQHLTQAISSAKDREILHTVAVIDIDNFKVVNDGLGIEAGDAMMKSFVSLFNQCFRTRDISSRLDGDEFGILFERTSLNDAQLSCERFRKMVQEWVFEWEGRKIGITVSIGLSQIDSVTMASTSILLNCNLALSRAKENGKNRIEVFSDSERFRECASRLETYIKIKSAIEENNLLLFCQPIIPLDESEHSHYEVLVRMRDDKRILLPNKFLDVSEHFRIVFDLDMWVIERTLKFISTFMKDIKHNFTINLSGQTVGDLRTVSTISKLFEKYSVPFHRIGFEVTETAEILDFNEAQRTIMRIRSLGCHVLIDDFGVGQSSLSRLQKMQADIIKIDGSFVKDICTDRFDCTVVKSIVEIAKTLNMKTVAEFVHTEEVFDKVKSLGVNYAQGFYLGRPLPMCSLLCTSSRCNTSKDMVGRMSLCNDYQSFKK